MSYEPTGINPQYAAQHPNWNQPKIADSVERQAFKAGWEAAYRRYTLAHNTVDAQASLEDDWVRYWHSSRGTSLGFGTIS